MSNAITDVEQLEINIFNRLKSASNEEIVAQIAMYRTMTLKENLSASLESTRAAAGKMINFFSRKTMGREVLAESEALNIVQKMEAERSRLSGEKRDALDRFLLQEVASSLRRPQHTDSEMLSALLIESAAAGLKIDKEISIGSQAHIIAERIQERMLTQVQRALKRMNAVERLEYERQIDASLEKITSVEQEAMAKALGVSSLTGATLRKMLIGASAPAVLMALVNMSGFGAYLMITTVIHAVFTTMLGITLPFAVYQNATAALSFLTGPFGFLLMASFGGIPLFLGNRQHTRTLHAQTVWTGVRASTLPIAAADTMLPSYGSTNAQAHFKELRSLQAILDNLYSELDRAREAIQSEEKIRLQTQQKLNVSLSKLREAEKERAGLEKITHNLRNKLNALEAEYKQVMKRTDATKEEVEDVKSRVEQFKAELHNSEREISEYDKLLEEADRENKLLKDKFEQANRELEEQRTRTAQLASAVEKQNDKYVSKLEKTSRELKDTWAVRFSRFEFSSKALRFAASLPLDERLEVERYLVELDSAENPCAHTRGKMRGQGGVQHDSLRLGPNKPGRIQFSAENGVIRVVDIYLRKDQNKTDRQY